MSYSGNLLVENRNGLIVDAEVFEANGTAERHAALVMLEQISSLWSGYKTLRQWIPLSKDWMLTQRFAQIGNISAEATHME